jgi:beta-glucosidase
MNYKRPRTKTFVFLLTALVVASSASAQSIPVYRDAHRPLEARVNDLFSRLTLDEKMDLLTGTAFTTRPIPRLGVPPAAMADAGQGVRGGMDSTTGPASAFPSGVAMASSWDPELVGRIGKAIGEEARNKGTGVQIMLGPAINIHRSPLGGRNGEYFSEDPFLAARLAVGFIRGMQSTGIAACAKHYAANNEEVDRGFIDVRVGERALREIYLPAFEAAVKEGHVWTVMSSYNQVNGYHSSANKFLLTEVLKKNWGFDGMVMSDWGGVHETVGAVVAGNDLEMPGPGFLQKDNIALALKKGQITTKEIDDNVRRILRAVIRVGVLDTMPKRDPSVVNSAAHKHLTYEAATKGIILLKNSNNVLPLDGNKIKSIAVIGPAATNMQVGAAGSPWVEPFYTIEPLAALKARAKPGTTFRYVRGTENGEAVPASALTPSNGQGHGLFGEYFANKNLEGTPTSTQVDNQIQFNWPGSPAPGVGHENFSVRWTGQLTPPKTGKYHLVLSADDGCRLSINGKLLIDHWVDTSEAPIGTNVDLVAGKAYDIKIEYYQAAGDAVARLFWTLPGADRYREAADAARKSDVAIVCVSTLGQEGEGTDRPSMDLPGGQDALIQAVAAANKRTIVILNDGTPVTMTSWINRVPSLVESWFPGQEGGAALASVLFGDVNPSGKLPDTLGAKREDYPDFGHFPGKDGHVDYTEGIYVGYRHFDKKGIAPVFPFGYGLSYTTFRYGALHVSGPSAAGLRTVTLKVTNTGHRAGAEVVELYIRDLKPKIDRPIRELKGFGKVSLNPGETKTVTIALTPRAFAYFDASGKQWKADAGRYEVEVGASSRDIRLHSQIALASTYREPVQK